MNHPAPLEGTPNKDMFTKYGLVAVAYSKLWHKYTKKDSESQWPLMGSFDDHKIETLEIALRSNKTTPTMLDSIGMWRKETTQRKRREKVKAEKELRKAAHLVARKLEEEIKERKEAKQKQESETSGQCPVRTPSTLYPELPSKQRANDELLLGPPIIYMPPPYAPSQPIVQHPQPPNASESSTRASVLTASAPAEPLVLNTTLAITLDDPETRKKDSARINRLTKGERAGIDKVVRTLVERKESEEYVTDMYNSYADNHRRHFVVRLCYHTLNAYEDRYQDRGHEGLATLYRKVDIGEEGEGDVTDLFTRTLEVFRHLKEHRQTTKTETPIATEAQAGKADTMMPIKEAAPYWVPPRGQGTHDDINHQDAKGRVVYNWVYQPWDRQDILTFRKTLPDLRKNPTAFYTELVTALGSTIMTLADIDLFFGLCLPADVWKQIRKVDHAEPFGYTWVQLDTIDKQREPGQKPLKAILELPDKIVQKLKTLIPERKVDWSIVTACRQKPQEDVSEYFSRFETVFSDYSGQDMTTATGHHLFVQNYVKGLLQEVSQKLQTSESSWAASKPAAILQMAQYYEHQKNENDRASERKKKELKERVMIAQLQGVTIGREPPKGSYQPTAPRKLPPRDHAPTPYAGRRDLDENQCAFCKGFGHWKSQCPVLLGMNKNRDTRDIANSPRNGGQGRGYTNDTTNDRPDRPNTFDRPRQNQCQQSDYENTHDFA
ncbi:hypothetical protein NDU88_010307 [Pleurodeles waltl]|uniref:Uncharacterized protein n=1 Tax=Pleurodeles waltl TaxID=8319 RepID=A0AAV7RYW0_PLEWA|nr:hypothetical protein NDU88_010307 [Pleurodeles waltl]